MIVQQNALGDLQLQSPRRDIVGGHQLAEPFGKAPAELDAGYVDRQEARVDTFLAPRRPVAARLLENPVANADDLPGGFRQRNEEGGADETLFRVLPAQQHLGAAMTPAGGLEDRLKVERQLAELHRQIEIVLEL